MREILFRGKRLSDGKWLYGLYADDYVYDADFPCIMPLRNSIDGDYCDGDCAVIRETVGQYTGLTDKNGTKIFEGDVVRYGDTAHRVVFEQRNGTAYFGLVYSPLETLPFGHYQDLKQITVVGNIHDNPELLEESE